MLKMRGKSRSRVRFNPRTAQGDRYTMPDVRTPMTGRAHRGRVRTVAEVTREIQLARMIYGPR